MTNYVICMISACFLAYLIGSHYKKLDTALCSIIAIATFIRYWPSFYITSVGTWASYVQYISFIFYIGFSFYTAITENKRYEREKETRIVSILLFACFIGKKIAVNLFLNWIYKEGISSNNAVRTVETAGIVFHFIECFLILGLFFLYWMRNTKKRPKNL